MQKIRINDLARELEVKSKAILDALVKVGVTEKKTHSSSIEVDEAERVKRYFAEHAEPGSGRSSRAAAPAADEFKPKIDLSHISKPGDVREAGRAKGRPELRGYASVPASEPNRCQARRDRRWRLRQLSLLQGQRLRLQSLLRQLRAPLP